MVNGDVRNTMDSTLTQVQLDDATRTRLVGRLKIIEGQARGIERMLEAGRACEDILTELSALQAASRAVSMRAVEAFALSCLRESPDAPEAVMAYVLGVVTRLTQ